MRVVSFNSVTFDSLNVYATIIRNLGGSDRSPDFLSRRGATPIGNGVRAGSRPIRCNFYPELAGGVSDEVIESRMRRLLNTLDPLDDTPKPLVCEIQEDTDDDGDIDTTYNVTVDVVVGPWNWMSGAKGIELTFFAESDLFEKITPTVEGPDTIARLTPTMTVVNDGATTVYPVVVRSAPTVAFVDSQMSSKQISITNHGELPLDRETVVIPLSASLTSTDSLPGTPLKDGNYLAATQIGSTSATGKNTISSPAAAHLAFPVTIAAGDTEVYDIILGLQPERDLDTATRFDGNYSALDLSSISSVVVTASTTTLVTAGGQAWTADRWIGACFFVYAGTGVGQARLIGDNAPTTLTPARALAPALDSTSRIIIFGSGWYYDGGAVTSATVSSITDSAQTFDPGSLAGGTVTIYAGTGNGQTKDIDGNTPTGITIVGTWGVTPDSTSRYRVQRYGYHRYFVDQITHTEDHRGAWQQNARFSPPSKTIFGGGDVLNGFEPALIIKNNDDYNQLRTTPVAIGSPNHYFPIMNTTRRKGQKTRLQQEGQFDSVVTYHPWGYVGARFDFMFLNQNSVSGATLGICEATIWSKEAGGDHYTHFVYYDGIHATSTLVAEAYYDLTDVGTPEHFGMGLAPQGYNALATEDISNTAKGSDKANMTWNNTLRLWVDVQDKWDYTVSSASFVIPIDDEIRVGDYALQIGQRDGQRLWMAASGVTLHFDCANARAWTDDGANIVDVTYAVHPVEYGDFDGDGVEDYRTADRWLPIAPGTNTVTASGSPWDDTFGFVGSFTLTFTFTEATYG